MAPKELIGLTGGVTSLAANIGGVVTPIVIGGIVQATGSFAYAFNYIGAIALLSYSFLLGPLYRITSRAR